MIVDQQNKHFFTEFIITLEYVGINVHLQECNHDPPCNMVYNTEQLTRKEWLNKMSLQAKKSVIIDYSITNIQLLQNANCIFLPILYIPQFIFTIQNKEYDIVHIGWLNKRRSFIIDQLYSYGYKILIINNNFNFNEKYQEIFKGKLLLNIHADIDYNIMEYARCSIPVFNSQIIVSENVIDKLGNDTINDYVLSKIIFATYDELVSKVIHVLNSFETYKYTANSEYMTILTKKHIDSVQKNKYLFNIGR